MLGGKGGGEYETKYWTKVSPSLIHRNLLSLHENLPHDGLEAVKADVARGLLLLHLSQEVM